MSQSTNRPTKEQIDLIKRELGCTMMGESNEYWSGIDASILALVDDYERLLAQQEGYEALILALVDDYERLLAQQEGYEALVKGLERVTRERDEALAQVDKLTPKSRPLTREEFEAMAKSLERIVEQPPLVARELYQEVCNAYERMVKERDRLARKLERLRK